MSTDETLRVIVRRAIERQGIPLPEMWKNNVAALCERVVMELIGHPLTALDGRVSSQQDKQKEPT